MYDEIYISLLQVLHDGVKYLSVEPVIVGKLICRQLVTEWEDTECVTQKL